MQILLNTKISDRYNNNSQKIRVLTEDWVGREIFCPMCGNDLIKHENNKKVADFFCHKCNEDYELKSKKNKITNNIMDGSYNAMIERIQSNNNPNFFFLNYDVKKFIVNNFIVIPKYFFVPDMIIKRKNGLKNRPNYIMCNIDLSRIPQTGKIFYIKNQKIELKSKILNNWQKTLFLREQKELLSKGWILDVMNCIDKLGINEFKLDEVYKFENVLQTKHPDNKHIKDKIRQQLQLLRDKGYLSFVSRGKYKLN